MESPVLLGIISTHTELTSLCLQISLPGVKLLINEGALETSLQGLRLFEEKGVEAIVTTRGNAVFIKEHTNLPVISIPENNFDIFLPLARALKKYGPNMTLFFYREPPKGLDEIEEVMGFKPKTSMFNNSRHLESLLEKLRGSGEVIVGGGFVCQLASSLGFITEQVNRNKESVLDALEAARELAVARRVERKEACRLQTILDWIHEGIIATDERGMITLFNKVAEKIFNLKAEDVLGCNSKEILENVKIPETLLTKEASFGEIIRFGNSEVAVNRIPVLNQKKEISGVVATVQPIQAIQDLEEKIRRQLTTDRNGIRYNFEDIKGESRAIRSTIELAQKFAHTDEAVLIIGESGTGKEMFAQSIHAASKRKNKPFLAINCAAIPGTLLESELFGYSEGAFTGARKGGKAGLFELAHGGTIFLDEIGEMPLDVQAKLLRVIQEKEVRRVGGERLVRIDVRIIAATHRDLWELVVEGKFRQDLFYRLDVLRLLVPPLRQRKEDIFCLALEFLNNNAGLSLKQKKILAGALAERAEYDWPGNVRELENIVRRMVVLTRGLTEAELKGQVKKILSHFSSLTAKSVPRDNITVTVSVRDNFKEMIDDVEKQVLRYFLDSCGGDRTKAARKLGIGRTTLWRKLTEVNVNVNDVR